MQEHKRDRAPMRRQHFNAWLYPASRPDVAVPGRIPKRGPRSCRFGPRKRQDSGFRLRASRIACRAQCVERGGPVMGAAHGAGMRYRAAAMDGAAGALQRAAIDGARVVERELLEASEDFAAVQCEAGDHALDIVFVYVERA